MFVDSDIIATMKSKRKKLSRARMTRSITDIRSNYQLEAEEQKTAWWSKIKMDRQGHKDPECPGYAGNIEW